MLSSDKYLQTKSLIVPLTVLRIIFEVSLAISLIIFKKIAGNAFAFTIFNGTFLALALAMPLYASFVLHYEYYFILLEYLEYVLILGIGFNFSTIPFLPMQLISIASLILWLTFFALNNRYETFTLTLFLHF